mmetsp:Transcript_28936/g.49298  ORF Transcript_28936/g.49298 Transcript_28936/m.49298 type:complete len:202 (+) Transcript_28936:447-1052(+)
MPKLHYVSKRFLKKEGYRECLANGQRIQGQQDADQVQVNNTTTINNATKSVVGESNINQQGGGGSLLNGNKKEKSKINNRETGVKRRRPDVESSSAIDLNQTNGSGNHNQGPANSTTSVAPAAAAAGASVNLVRRNQNIIWVRIGLTDHPAFELYNPDNPDNDGSTVWVQYTSNGVNECVSRSQIKNGLQDRKRHRPTYYH